MVTGLDWSVFQLQKRAGGANYAHHSGQPVIGGTIGLFIGSETIMKRQREPMSSRAYKLPGRKSFWAPTSRKPAHLSLPPPGVRAARGGLSRIAEMRKFRRYQSIDMAMHFGTTHPADRPNWAAKMLASKVGHLGR